jgi:triosephosphate isomerase (TIM)
MPGRQLIAGNWKMNGLSASLAEARAIAAGAPGDADLVLCPPFTLIAAMGQALAGSSVALGGQDCHQAQSGAFTGDVSAAMLADLGAHYVIVGHSERRQFHAETDVQVAAKAAAALAAGLTPIVCVGESEAQRDAGDAEAVVAAQTLASLAVKGTTEGCVLAYEPIWAIGSGRTPSASEVQTMHAALRAAVAAAFGPDAGAGLRILYGGSVKPDNAAGLLALEDVDGALVGGASLKSGDFLSIAGAAKVCRA